MVTNIMFFSLAKQNVLGKSFKMDWNHYLWTSWLLGNPNQKPRELDRNNINDHIKSQPDHCGKD